MKEQEEAAKESIAPGATAVAGSFSDVVPVRNESGDQSTQHNNNASLPRTRSIATATLVEDEYIVIAEPVDVVTPDHQNDAANTRKKQVVAIAFLLVILVAVTLALIAVRPGRNPTPNWNPQIDESDTLQSSLRRESMIEALADISEYGTESFDVDSPFFSSDRMAALNWMVDTDPKQLPIPEYNETGNALNSTEAKMLRKLRQRYITALLYFATNGDEWYDKFEFLSEFDECEWNTIVGIEKKQFFGEPISVELKGIFCDKEGWIVEYLLWWNNLSGTLPSEIAYAMEDTISLNMNGGSVSGTIPSTLTKLSNLEGLVLADNCFTGYLPEGSFSDGSMANLKVIALHNNANIKGSLNGFCDDSGTAKLQGITAVAADCPADGQINDNSTEGILCDCCICCNRDVFECTDLESGDSYSFLHKGVTTDSVILSSTVQCLSSKQKQYIRDECPCVMNPEDDFQLVYMDCTQNCTEDTAIPSHNFDLD